jgi:lipopolysaccharide/colanic/teichoic acid biosynthesis glycosyltransferase
MSTAIAQPSQDAAPVMSIVVSPRTSTARRGRGRTSSRPRRAPAHERISLARHGLENDRPLVEPEGNRAPFYLAAKRTLDIAGGLALLIFLSPVLLATLAVLLVTTRGRPFFVQERIGYLGRRFPMIKFRTMRLDADKLQHIVANEHSSGPIFKNRADPRITRIGRILRKTSIDELPQLVNVLLGHMSLVGPRPPVAKEVARYEPWQRRRLAVKPGLTCLWQISGRSEIGFADWVRMDLWYLKHQSLWTDVKLLLATPWAVLTCRGAY